MKQKRPGRTVKEVSRPAQEGGRYSGFCQRQEREIARDIRKPEDLERIFHDTKDESAAAIRTQLRTLACCHPLEFNKELFKNIELILFFSVMPKDDLRYIKEKAEGLDIWQDIKNIEGIDGEQNLWFVHPIYFINHLDILYHSDRVNNLLEVQDIVMNTPFYKPGAVGPFGRSADTWCNLSTCDVLEATGFHTDGLYNDGFARGTNANAAAKNLIEMEKQGKAVKISPQEAQQKANDGYTVIVAWYNETQPDAKGVCHGHLSTVRPNKEQFDIKKGPQLANIGINVGPNNAVRVFFGAYTLGDTKFYYDPNQVFIFDETKMWCKGAAQG
jgi:hypothetical protein